MVVRGRVHQGVVVPEGGCALPEGASVIVSCPDAPSQPDRSTRRVHLPLVPSDHPGSLPLTADRIAEFLEGDDVPA